MEGSRAVTGTSDYILVVILITMLTAQLGIRPLLNKLSANFDEIFQDRSTII